MSTHSAKNLNIIRENIDLIHLVINAMHFSAYMPSLTNNLKLAEENGWDNLVSSINRILSGERDLSSFNNLDNEDTIIISEILSILKSQDAVAQVLLQQPAQLCSQGNLSQAESACKNIIEILPESADAHAQLGYVLQSQRKIDESVLFYEKAIALNPDHAGAYLNLGAILQEQKKFTLACECFEKALEIKPDLLPAIEHLTYLYEKAYKLDDSQSLVERGLRLSPNNCSLNLVQSKLLQRKGNFEEAVKFLEIASQSNDRPALYGEIHSRLGYLYDRLDQVDKAFESYSKGNQFSQNQFSQQKIDKHFFLDQADKIAEIANVFDSSLSNHVNNDSSIDTPVFLVGFPRSGTTLMNQVLDCHPGLQALEEKPSAYNMVMKFFELTNGSSNPLAEISDHDVSSLRKVYYDTVSKHIERDKSAIFIDKFPLNIAYVPIIWRVFPRAKFILALRHPCDASLSCFMHSFGVNSAMASFLDMEDTVSLYAKLMSNWFSYTEKFKLNFHMIKYENLVDDLKKEAGDIFNFLNLEWSDEVLSHTDKARARGVIDTPSYDQITQPIYKHATYRWTRYKSHIDTNIKALDPFIDAFEYND